MKTFFSRVPLEAEGSGVIFSAVPLAEEEPGGRALF
jgi:hypothetical protein